jgi:hypothetical protein
MDLELGGYGIQIKLPSGLFEEFIERGGLRASGDFSGTQRAESRCGNPRLSEA